MFVEGQISWKGAICRLGKYFCLMALRIPTTRKGSFSLFMGRKMGLDDDNGGFVGKI